MGVYIRGMEMPQNCAECFFHKVFPTTGVGINQLYCALCGINIVKLSDAQPDCPLVPVPPHGRLIDADALAEHKFLCVPHVTVNGEEAGTAYRLGWNTAIEAIMENAETVIGGE